METADKKNACSNLSSTIVAWQKGGKSGKRTLKRKLCGTQMPVVKNWPANLKQIRAGSDRWQPAAEAGRQRDLSDSTCDAAMGKIRKNRNAKMYTRSEMAAPKRVVNSSGGGPVPTITTLESTSPNG
ncbi:hypothetical protein M513_05451 [Trichuris suis]|uniref:Uncharacterized protein n=1 Tax=Trichuris suis TaxID=68888 RepID=A0A085M950_9BILA|nr:hypothetical protein M513_05451 [Trichuris suis]